MLRLALKSLLAHKLRFAFTALAIVLGVAFVVAAFVTADSLRSTFDDLAADINTGTDFTVRGALPFGDITQANPPPVDDSLLDDIRAVDRGAVGRGRLLRGRCDSRGRIREYPDHAREDPEPAPTGPQTRRCRSTS